MIRRSVRMAIGLLAAAGMRWGVAATLPENTVDGTHWQIVAATALPDGATVAARRKEQILVWDNGKAGQVASSVLLLVEAPYRDVQPVVQRALESQGKFTAREENGPLSYLPSGWDEVLLSHRSDLRHALAERFALPRLQLAVTQGALTPAEMEQRLAQEYARVDSVPQDRNALDAFRVTYPDWYATQHHSYGLTGKQESTLSVDVFDVTAMFGHPATAVQIRREDSYANPNYHPLTGLAHFNILSTPPARTLSDNIVPASVFLSVRDALASLPGKMEIARSPLAWVQTVAPATATPSLALMAPATDVPVIKAQAISWDVLVADRRSRLYPHDLLALPDGDLLFSAEVSDGSGRPQGVWRLHQASGEWKVEEIWRGAQGSRQLSLSADGRTVWFDGTDARQASRELLAYDVDTHHVTHHVVTWPGVDRDDIYSLRWELAGDQQPAIFNHDYRLGDDSKNLLGYEFLSVLRPVTPPSPADDTWPFGTAFSSARQSMMSVRMQGNTLIWPVRWRDPKVFWVEDQPGIAELDASSGRVLRALALPQRFGSPDPDDATGAAQWVPKPLGSPEAGWIAAGFVLMLADDGHMPPSLDKTGNRNDRFVGMHVVNLSDGRVLSALLGRADTLEAAARSAHGRFLALGANGIKHSGPHVVLWDVAQARTPVQFETSSQRELHALAFSWNGADLWALGDRELFRWPLPDSLRDAAVQGSFPDQSHN